MTSQTHIVELEDYQFIKIGGPDFRKFLQGQLSCNLDLLKHDRSLRGAMCNLKGRVIADLRVLLLNDACLLQVGQGMANPVVTTLSKYAVFSKVKLEIQDFHPAPFGLIGELPAPVKALFPEPPAEADAVSQIEDASPVRIAGAQPRYELWMHNKAAAQALRTQLSTALPAPLRLWKRADIAAGIAHVSLGTTEEYTPQLLNYDISGVIDFKKGCYTGQEVVARMFYRGVAKKRLYLGSTTATIQDGDSVHQEDHADGRNDSIVAYSNAAPGSDEPTLLLAILGTDAIEAGARFTLTDQPETTLHFVPLQY